jgi:hypothetical protein
MARDTKGKGKEIEELHHDEAQGSHPTEQSLVEPFPVAPKATATEDNPRPNQADVDGTKSARVDVPPSDPLEIQIKDMLVLASDSGDGDALRRAAILNAQFQAVVHASNVPGPCNVDGAHSEDSGYQTNESGKLLPDALWYFPLTILRMQFTRTAAFDRVTSSITRFSCRSQIKSERSKTTYLQCFCFFE